MIILYPLFSLTLFHVLIFWRVVSLEFVLYINLFLQSKSIDQYMRTLKLIHTIFFAYALLVMCINCSIYSIIIVICPRVISMSYFIKLYFSLQTTKFITILWILLCLVFLEVIKHVIQYERSCIQPFLID